MNSSSVGSHRMWTSAFAILYSPMTALISSCESLVSGTVVEMAIPPLSFFLTEMLGGCLFSRMPNPSSSFSMTDLSPSGLSTSRTIQIKLQVRATIAGREASQSRAHVERNSSEAILTGNDLTTTTLSVLGTLDNPGQVENLDRRAVNRQGTGDTAEEGISRCRMNVGESDAHVVKVAASRQS